MGFNDQKQITVFSPTQSEKFKLINYEMENETINLDE